jgi:hypothetical protein
MAMTKEKAKEILEEYLMEKCLIDQMALPINDEIVYENPMFNVYSFVGLLCIAYNLQEKPK